MTHTPAESSMNGLIELGWFGDLHARLGVRRFAQDRSDGRCYELYNVATGECASLPGTKRDLTAYLKAQQAEGKG